MNKYYREISSELSEYQMKKYNFSDNTHIVCHVYGNSFSDTVIVEKDVNGNPCDSYVATFKKGKVVLV